TAASTNQHLKKFPRRLDFQHRDTPAAFQRVAENYNTATQKHLSPIPHGGPNPMFAMMTKTFMEQHGLEARDMGLLPISQRRWAMGNPRAAYRKDLSLEDYLGARVVYDPLSAYDCVPVVSGAEAILISHQVDPGQHVEVVAQELP